MKALCVFLLAIALAWFGYRHFVAPIAYPPGVLIAAEPEQIEIADQTEPITRGSFKLKPLAQFSVDARVLHRRNYRYDREAALVPTDLALGWGEMSDQAVLDRLTISQSMRFFFYEYQRPPPIPQDEIMRHSTNVHIIPADAAVQAACHSLRSGELIHLDGQLVEASSSEFGTWRSSLRRDDTGKGACELLYTEHVWKLDAHSPSGAGTLVRR